MTRTKILLVVAVGLAYTVSGILTQGGTVTAHAIYENYYDCVSGNQLVDGMWPSNVFGGAHCLPHTSCLYPSEWFNINMGAKTVVETVFIVNREDCCSERIYGTDLYVGDNSTPNLNTACGVYPTSTGFFSCGGKIGQYLGLYKPSKDCMNISQIRAYSYKPSAYPYQIFLSANNLNCPAVNLSALWQNSLLDYGCFFVVDGAPPYINIVFNQPRFVQVVTLVGHSWTDFTESQNWLVTAGSATGASVTQNTVYGQYVNWDYDRHGKEIKIAAMATSIGIYRNDNLRMSFRWIAVFTTASNCSGAFDWSGSRASWRIPITTAAQTITGLFFAKIDDCAVFHSPLVLSDGTALPSYVTYDVYSHTMTVNVAASQAPATITVKACANLNDKVTTPKSECQTKLVELIYVASTSLSWATSPFNSDAEQTGSQITFSFPAVNPTPANAFLTLTFALLNAPSFLTLQQSGNAAQGVISANPTTGTFNYKIKVTDSVSALSSTLNASLYVYNCMPTGMVITPNSQTVRISGPSLTSTFSFTATYAACGSYTATVDPAFAYLVTVTGSQIAVQAPVTAATGVFSPVITLKRTTNTSQATTATITVTVQLPLMTSLAFSLTPPATSFYSESEQTGSQAVFNFPAITWAPLNADKVITFSLVGAPTFLTLTQTGTSAQGVINASATTGTFAYQVVVTDSVSSLSSTLNSSLQVYNCMPTGMVITPSSQIVRISGPSLTSTFSFAATYTACGTYTATVDSAFAYLVTVTGSQIAVQAPVTATTGVFFPVITLKRDTNTSQATTATITVTVQLPLMTSLSFSLTPPATSFNSESEQTGSQAVFDFPAITWAPLNADKVITFSLVGAPTFLTLTQTGTSAQGVISAAATTGTFNYQVTVTDSVSSLSSTLNASLYIYNCMPTGMVITPNSQTVRISGPSLTSTFSFAATYTACGTYTATVDSASAYLVTVTGSQIAVQAPVTATTGVFSPVITLKRDTNTSQATTATITVTVQLPLMTSLSFSLTPPATSFNSESEQTGSQAVFDFPAITWAPLNADKVITFSLVGAPTFLTLTQTGTSAQGVISAAATTGTFNYQVTVTDSVSSLSSTLNASLYVYNCMPTGMVITPNLHTLRISGPSFTSSWSYTANYVACGTYTATVDPAFAYLVTVTSSQIVVQAPVTATSGVFNPVVTLSRDSNPTYFTTASVAVTIQLPLMTSLSFSLTPPAISFYHETEQAGLQVVFDFPAIIWTPLNADKVMTFALVGPPGFLTLTQTSTSACGVISASATTGTFAFQVTVKDQVSSLSSTLEAVLFIYNCAPTGFALTPSSISISILGKSETVVWAMNANYQACGSYSITVESTFASLISVKGQQLTLAAPKTATTGSFAPVITLKRENNPSQQIIGSLSLTVTRCMVTQLSFSKQPTSSVTVDLATFTEPISMPFDTKQTPQCENQVAFTLAPGSLTFLSVSSSSISGGQILVKDAKVTTDTTYAVTLRTFVDGLTAETNFSVIVKPKPLPKPEPTGEQAPTQEDKAQTSDQQAQMEPQAIQAMTPAKQQEAVNQATFDWRAAFEAQKKLQAKEVNASQSTFVPAPPNPFFKEVKVDGKILIGFSSDVRIVPNLQMINNGTIYLDDFGRELAVSTMKNVKKKNFPVLQVEVLPGLESKAEDLSFRWNVTQQDVKTLQVQLYFDYPLNVSANTIPDTLRVTFNDPILFGGLNGLTMDTQVLQQPLPQQVPLGGTEAAVLEAFGNTANGAKAVVVGNFIFNLLMSASLNQLWSMINTQQLIVTLPLFQVQMPASAQVFFNQIFKIASFNIIDIDPYINKMLKLNETEPYNANFDSLGFNSMYFLNNMNSLLLGFILYFTLIVTFLVFDQMQLKWPKLSNFTEKLRYMLFYNFILSMLTESYSMIAVCCMIGLNKMTFSLKNYGETVQTACCLLALLVLVVYPPLVFWTLQRNWLQINEIRKQFEPIFEDLTTKIGPITLLHPMYFLLRRFLMAVNVVFLQQNLIFQIMLKDFTIIMGIMLVGYIRFETRAKLKTEFMNETVVMSVLYCMMCFSPFVSDIGAKQTMGYFCCFLVALHLAINLYLIVASSFRQIIMNAKLWLALRKLSKERELNVLKKQARIHTRKAGIALPEQEVDDESKQQDSDRPVAAAQSILDPIKEESNEEDGIVSESSSYVRHQYEKFQVQEELRKLEQLVEQHFIDSKLKMDAIKIDTKMGPRNSEPEIKEEETYQPNSPWHDLDTRYHQTKPGRKRVTQENSSQLFQLDHERNQFDQNPFGQGAETEIGIINHSFYDKLIAESSQKKPQKFNGFSFDIDSEMNQVDSIINEVEERWNKHFGDPDLEENYDDDSKKIEQSESAFEANDEELDWIYSKSRRAGNKAQVFKRQLHEQASPGKFLRAEKLNQAAKLDDYFE